MNPLPEPDMSQPEAESKEEAERRDRVQKIIEEDREILDDLA